MTYKESIKTEWPIITRLKVIKDILFSWLYFKDIAIKYHMSRNSITNIKKIFDSYATLEAKELLNSHKPLSIEDINKHFSFLIPISRKPHKIRWLPPNTITNLVLDEFNILWYWYKRMYHHLIRKGVIPSITKIYTIKGIYKRNNIRIKKVRTHNKEYKAIYNYSQISPFQYLHYDVKHILDLWALPKHIYDLFNLNKDLPIYERNVIDAYSRFRFIAYSNSINSTFGFYFIQYVIMHIRYSWIDYTINCWMDNWTEFTSWSADKTNSRNENCKYLDVNFYTYDHKFDNRKNLIERSHKSDDEEFFVPRWYFINSKKDFLREAHLYFLHRNTTRIHFGKNMYTTPYKKLQYSHLFSHKRLLEFPTLILEDCINDLMYFSKTISLVNAINTNSIPLHNKKSFIDFQVNLNIINNNYAQNVLHLYQNKGQRPCLLKYLLLNSCSSNRSNNSEN